MKYIIYEVENDMQEELGQFGLDFEDSDIVTTFSSEDDGYILEVPEHKLTIFKTLNHIVAVFPVEDHIYETVDTYQMLHTYAAIIEEDYHDYTHVVGTFQTLTGKVIDPEVWIVSIPATLLEDKDHTFSTKKGSETVRVRSYIIKKDGKPNDVIRFNTHAVHSLCNNALDFTYLQNSLKPSDMVNVLVTIFDKDDTVVAIRTTKMRSGLRAEIKGAYACSKGFGKLIQDWTENLIRTHDDALFPTSVAHDKPVTFRLSALPSAVGFWKHVGFVSTGKFDKEDQEILEKRIYPDTVIGKKRQHSPTSSNTSTKTYKNNRVGSR